MYWDAWFNPLHYVMDHPDKFPRGREDGNDFSHKFENVGSTVDNIEWRVEGEWGTSVRLQSKMLLE